MYHNGLVFDRVKYLNEMILLDLRGTLTIEIVVYTFGHNLTIHQCLFLLLGSKDCPSEALQNELKKWEENHTLRNPTISTSRKPVPTPGRLNPSYFNIKTSNFTHTFLYKLFSA